MQKIKENVLEFQINQFSVKDSQIIGKISCLTFSLTQNIYDASVYFELLIHQNHGVPIE